MEPITVISLAIAFIGLVFAFIRVLYLRKQKTIAQKSYQLQVAREIRDTEGSFIVTSVEELPKYLVNYPSMGIPYIARGPTDTQKEIEALSEQKKVLITGRTGLGKTREAIEEINLLESRFGEKFTVCLIKLAHNLEPILPAHATTRNLVLLLDDIHLLKQRFVAFQSILGVSDTFESWVEKIIAALDTAAEGHLWVIATLRDEPGITDILSFSEEPWNGFHIHKLHSINKQNLTQAIPLIASKFGVNLAEEAISIIAEKSDGTFMGLISYFKRKSSQGELQLLNSNDVVDFSGTYPLIWKMEYERFIKPTKSFRYIFESLGAFRRLGITPEVNLIVELTSMRFRFPWVVKRTLPRALSKLNAWLEIEALNGTKEHDTAEITYFVVRCADAYLDALMLSDVLDSALKSQLANLIIEYRYGKKRHRLTQEINSELDDATIQLAPFTTSLLIKRLSHPRSFQEIAALALDLARVRETDAVPILINAFAFLKHVDGPVSIRQEIAIALGYITAHDALPTIFEAINESSPGMIRNDIISILPNFQDFKSIQYIIGEIRSWSSNDLEMLAHFAVEPFSNLTRRQTSEEIEEEKEFVQWFRTLMPDHEAEVIQLARKSRNERVRFRGYLAAATSGCMGELDWLGGLDDPSAKIRTLVLLLYTPFGDVTSPWHRVVFQRIRDLRSDNLTYDGIPIAKVAEQVCRQVTTQTTK